MTSIVDWFNRRVAPQEPDMTYLAETDADNALTPLQAASCTYRIALGPRAGRKVLSLRAGPSGQANATSPGCATEHGFTLHTAVRLGAHQRSEPVPLHHPPRHC